MVRHPALIYVLRFQILTGTFTAYDDILSCVQAFLSSLCAGVWFRMTNIIWSFHLVYQNIIIIILRKKRKWVFNCSNAWRLWFLIKRMSNPFLNSKDIWIEIKFHAYRFRISEQSDPFTSQTWGSRSRIIILWFEKYI